MSDYNFLMESRLSPEQNRAINHLSRIAASHGLNFYLVGGAVRDLTYGQQTIHDLDFAVEGDPQRILRHLEPGKPAARRGSASSPAGERLDAEEITCNSRLHSAEVVFANGVRAEVAACRSEIYGKPGQRPEVVLATIFEDLKRRDFSVNAMAISLHPNSRGLLLDPTNGASDLLKRELRVLYSRSFSDDPSRLYRLLRLGARLDFKPEERTRRHYDSALENRLWETLSPEQQGRELRAILQEENPGRVLRMLADRGLLAGLDRSLLPSKIPYDRFAKIRAAAKTVPSADTFLLNFHCLAEKLGGRYRSRLSQKVLLHKKDLKLAASLESSSKSLARALASSKASRPSYVYTLLSERPTPLLLFLLVYHAQVKVRNRLKAYILKVPQVRAKVPRAELQALGIGPGPKFEKILERIFFDQLDGKLKTHSQVMKQLHALAGVKEQPKHAAASRKAHKKASPARRPESRTKRRSNLK